MDDREERVAETFTAARDAVLAAAQQQYGREFPDFGSFYLWVLAEHDDATLNDWEQKRVADWVERLRAAGIEVDEAHAERIAAAAEAAVQVMWLDHDATRDSAFEFPTGGQRRMRVAMQLDDPFSPLNEGNPNWMEFA